MEECARTPFTRPFWLVELSHVFRILPFSMSVEFWEELKQFCDKWKKEFLENACHFHICGSRDSRVVGSYAFFWI